MTTYVNTSYIQTKNKNITPINIPIDQTLTHYLYKYKHFKPSRSADNYKKVTFSHRSKTIYSMHCQALLSHRLHVTMVMSVVMVNSDHLLAGLGPPRCLPVIVIVEVVN